MKSVLAAMAMMTISGVVSATPAEEEDDDVAAEPGTVTIVIPAELQNDWVYRTSAGGSDSINLSTKIEPEIIFQATENLSFLMGLTFEQVRDPDVGENEIFEGQGLFIETLTADYLFDPFALYVGKFTPHFGGAWDITPGIYGDTFAQDYEFSERWGVGGSVAFDETPLGDLEFSASVFMVDRTVLSNSVIAERGRTSESDGGPGNTDFPRSFAVAVNGSNLPILESLQYHIGYTQQAKGEGDTGILRGVVASAQVTVPIIGDIEATPLIEWASFENFDGVRGADRTIWTTAVQFDYDPWQLVVSYAKRDLSGPGDFDDDDRSFEITGGYNFDNGLLAEIGWWRVEQEGESADVIGARLSYEFGGQFRLY